VPTVPRSARLLALFFAAATFALPACVPIPPGLPVPPVSGGGGSPTQMPVTSFGSGQGRPFADASPFNSPIPANPATDSHSADIVGHLSSARSGAIADLYEYGRSVYAANATTPKVSVQATMAPDWGRDPFAGIAVPMPTNAQPAPGSDGQLVVVDYSTGRSYELWQAHRVDATHWTTSWGQITPNVYTGVGTETLTGGSVVAAGTSGLAGLVRAFEIRQGSINHALSFSGDAVTPGVFRYPAAHTDGSNMIGAPASSTIAEGTRVQLDPSIDLSKIPGITQGELVVGRALQKYGAYCVDQGGAPMAVGFENPSGDPKGDPYPSAGFAWDYYGMSHIPWSKLRVLRNWNGG